MKVGLVQQNDGTFGFVGHKVLDVLFTCDRAGRVVRIADINQTGIGVGLGHCRSIVRSVLAERNLHRPGTDEMSGSLAGFVSGVCHDEAPPGRAERKHRAMERVTRAGEGKDILLGQPLELSQKPDKGEGLAIQVPPSLLNDLVDRLCRFGARP